MPAKSIGAAQTSAAAHDTNTAAANEVLGNDATSASTAPKAPQPKMASTTTEIAPGVTATSSEVQAAPEATAAFRTFVVNLRITGFVAGSSPKALINGRLIRVGETVDSSLGITFVGVKDDQLLFKDKSGATVTRRY